MFVSFNTLSCFLYKKIIVTLVGLNFKCLWGLWGPELKSLNKKESNVGMKGRGICQKFNAR